jgi:hypothetical protein
MIDQSRKSVGELVGDRARVDRALGKAVQAALSRHKRLGQSVAVYKDGRVLRLTADQIVVPTDDAGTPAAPPKD